MDHGSKYIFFLIGKTGSGKSATGNSILGEKHYVSSDKGISVTKDVSVKTVTRHGCTVTAIDTPGVLDTSIKSDEAKSKSCTEMTAAMSQCPTDGKLAIVLVLKYGERFTEENRLTMYILKNIFGEKELWKSCIIVMTYGDVFKINNEDDVTFESWLRDQEDELGDLFKDCSYRCVLFNNRTKWPEENEKQFLELVNLTEQLDQDYTMNKFIEAKKQQNRLMLEEKLPEYIKNYDKKIHSLFSTLSVIFNQDGGHYDSFVNNIDKLLEELNELDSPEKIYYIVSEPLLLHEQRRNLIGLKQKVQTKVTLYELEMRGSNLKAESSPDENDWRLRVTMFEIMINHLEGEINSNTDLCEYQERLVSLQDSLKELLLIIKRHDVIDCYTRKINKLTTEINALPIPSALAKFTPFLVTEDKFRSEVVELNVELGGLGELLSKIDSLQKLIEYKSEDSSVTKGWNRTSLMMGVVSARTAFIPGVGIPLTIGLNALPLVGRTVHRQFLKYKNKSNLNQ